MAAAIDKRDVQGLVRTAFDDMTKGGYHVVRIRDAGAARAWLRDALPLVNDALTAKEGGDPAQMERALQVAFTWEGLLKLGVPENTDQGFSLEFQSGMAGEPNRTRRLGDVGKDAPEHWDWGGPRNPAHAVILVFTKGDLAEWTATVQGPRWNDAFEKVAFLDTSHLLNQIEPFGFKDGVSQPKMDWKHEREPESEELEFGNLITAGEFLLGYPNEYGKFTERPLVDERDDPHRILASAAGEKGKRDFGLNGTYLVFRDLAQDVRGFWRFLDAQSGGDREQREHLGSLVVGRTLDGRPLVPPSPEPIEGIEPKDEEYNRFTFDSDPIGVRCPIGSHIRRANPRVADLPPGSHGLLSRLKRNLGFGAKRPDEDLVSSARFHRLLRRGREYGPELTPDAAAKQEQPDGVRRGLRFVCLNANITRQFEFVQQAWSMATKFAGLTDQSDPLLGNRSPLNGCLTTSTYSIPQAAGLARCIQDVPQFVSVRGGGYFFLPSIRALRYIAAIGT